MSLPRPIVPNRTYLVTRRCTQQRFLFVPKPIVKQVFGYCLAVAQELTGVRVHAVMVMSNHYHVVATDPEGRIPVFSYVLHKYVARCMNAHYRRSENLWAGGVQTSTVHLADDAAMLDKAAYTIVNPVAAGLVARHCLWPGLVLWHPGRYKFRRPSAFFRSEGAMPESVKLELTPLPLSSQPRVREVMETLGQLVSEREQSIRRAFKRDGKRFMGVARVLHQHPEDQPDRRDTGRRLSPRVASRDKRLRIELLDQLKAFAIAYREALRAWVAGDRKVLFPAGTYKLRVEFGVSCAEA